MQWQAKNNDKLLKPKVKGTFKLSLTHCLQSVRITCEPAMDSTAIGNAYSKKQHTASPKTNFIPTSAHTHIQAT